MHVQEYFIIPAWSGIYFIIVTHLVTMVGGVEGRPLRPGSGHQAPGAGVQGPSAGAPGCTKRPENVGPIAAWICK
eukprot:SAG31_NODE_2045_length_6576_cov_3.774587_6_plen_75_part_00